MNESSPQTHTTNRSRRLPDINAKRCTGCGRCVAACDEHLLSFEVVRWIKFAVLHEPDLCTGCSLCALKCPFDAITMRKLAKSDGDDGGAPSAPSQSTLRAS